MSARGEEGPRKLRARYVDDGKRCLQDDRLFYPAKTISGETTENFCSSECAFAHMKASGRV